jgi:hypothetical protein
MWGVRSVYRAGSLMMVVKEVLKCKLDLVGVQEVVWDGWNQTSRQMDIFLWKGK